MAFKRMKRNHATRLPSRLAFYDCETRDINVGSPGSECHQLWFGCLRVGRLRHSKKGVSFGGVNEYRFDSKDQFWFALNESTRQDGVTWVFSHNAGFDATQIGLWERIRNKELKFCYPNQSRKSQDGGGVTDGLLLIEDPPTLVGVQHQEGNRYVFLDTLNYWRTSLAVLGRSIGLEKFEMPPTEAEGWYAYCQRDVEIIEKAVVQLLQWWHEGGFGNFAWTSPGLAMRAFRHKFSDKACQIDFHDDCRIRALERMSYFGGQLEAYKLGDIDEPVWQVDVTSLYPAVMKSNRFPVRLLSHELRPELTEARPPLEARNSLATVEIDSPHFSFPVQTPNGVVYAVGRGLVTLAGPELNFAEAKGLIRRWGSWATYICRELFTEYVDHFMELKSEYEASGNRVGRQFAKLLLNSLYGKFGQRGGKWVLNTERAALGEFGEFTVVDASTGSSIRVLSLYDRCYDWTPDNEIPKASPILASFVTAYARQHMRALRAITGRGNYYYQSTDSLMVNSQGLANLEKSGCIGQSELGKLNVEVEGPSAWIGGLHWYRIGDKVVEGSKKPSAETIDKLSWKQPQFESLKSVLTRGGAAEININHVIKKRSGKYNKGTPTESGWVEPMRLEDLSPVSGYQRTYEVIRDTLQILSFDSQLQRNALEVGK